MFYDIVFLMRFLQGFETMDIVTEVRANPTVWKRHFLDYDDVIDAASVEGIFQVELSPEGSNRNVAERRTLGFWRDFLVDLEGNLLGCEISNLCTTKD